MSVITNNLLLGDEGYLLERSLRFRSSASAYLNRTQTSGNRKTYTFSAWVKRGKLGTKQNIYGTIYVAGGGTNQQSYWSFDTDDTIEFVLYNGSSYFGWLRTTQVFRDPSAWYHLVVQVDTTQATSSNRVKLYINGSQITAFNTATYPNQNDDTFINLTTYAVGLGRVAPYVTSEYFDGYMTEINFIDGQALTPSSFGQTSATTGVWQPIKYTGTYGTNGFYLPFTDNSALTTSSNAGLGKDFSGNSNYWTTNNISITSGATYDSMTDVPTLTSATAANYCVFNPLDRGSTNFTLSNGNLNIVGASASSAVRATMAVSSGKWYWEATPTAIGNGLGVGFAGDSSRFNPVNWNSGTYVIYQSDGNKHINGSASSYGSSYTTNDVIGVALDMDGGTITFYKNNVSQGTASTGLTGVYLPVFSQTSGATTGTINANFGAGSGFTYTPPTGFKALNTFNLPTPTIGSTASTQANKYMDATLYTGAGNTSTSITNAGGFQPDLVWTKARSIGYNNYLFDSVRGTGSTKSLYSDNAEAEGTYSSNGNISSFNSNGWTIGTTSGTNALNASGQTFVGWQWRASGSTVSNTDGTITSTVSANTSAGFSIVTYTGNGTNGATVGHGLGVAPRMIFVKDRSQGGTYRDWAVYNTNIGAGNALYLNGTSGSFSKPSYWNSTATTSTLFTLGNDITVNQSGDNYVAYCFAEVAGYSKIGSYTGNGNANGAFVYTGFRPKYVLIKRTDSANNWNILNSSQQTYNQVETYLLADLANAEGSSGNSIDFLSNGFKLRTANAWGNANGGTYIYMAFAENPFKYSLAR